MERKVPWIRLTNDKSSWPKENELVLLWLDTGVVINATAKMLKYQYEDMPPIYFTDITEEETYVLYDVYAWMPIWFVLPNGLNTKVYEKLEMEEEWIV